MWKSLLTGALGLAALEFVLTLPSSQQGRLGSLLQLPGKWAEDLISPAVPLIPDLSTSTSNNATPSSSTRSAQYTPISTTAPTPTYAPVVQTTT
jgi:hypothetical protein